MQKKTSLLLIILIISISAFSQKVEKGYKFLNEGKYNKAIKVFDKCIDKRKNTTVARFGLAKIYGDKNYEGYNPIRSYNYTRSVVLNLERASQTQKKELDENFGLSEKSLNTLRNDLANDQMQAVKKTNTEQSYNLYIDIFIDMPQAQQVARHRDSLIYESIKIENDFDTYRAFCGQYPNSVFVADAKQRYAAIWKQMYNDVYSEAELSSIQKFERNYPDYPFYDKKTSEIKAHAQKADNLNMSLGYVANNHDYYVEFIKEAAPLEPAFVALQRYIAPDLDAQQWQDAADTLRAYKKYFPDEPRIDGLIEILERKPAKIVSQSVGKGVNTKEYEYMPVITADDRFMYFCGQQRADNIGGEDIFVSENIDGEWQKAKLVSKLSSAFAHEAPLSISADGNTMLMFYDSDIYYSKKTETGWTNKQEFPAINNHDSWEADAYLTADGNAILFISDRKGNVGNHHPFNYEFHGSATGNSDIYVSTKQENGRWSKPQNLGTAINTPFAERTPFLHPDMKTLYFSSEGHNSLGFLDVFKTTRLNDTSWTEWSEPVNLGKEINTSNKNWGYRISTAGEVAFYSDFSDKGADINFLSLPKELQPEKVAKISGTVTDKKTAEKLDANIVWENLNTAEKVGNLQSDPQTGAYIITLPLGKNYGFYVEKNGYYPLSGNIDLTKEPKNLNITKNFELISIQSIKSGEAAIPLVNVFFETAKYDLRPESFPELNRLVDFLQKNSDLKVEISGHTDNRGSAQYNKTLSENRAKSVKNYLIEKGCNADNLQSSGYGDTKPVADNNTEEGRSQNRRVEFKVLK